MYINNNIVHTDLEEDSSYIIGLERPVQYILQDSS